MLYLGWRGTRLLFVSGKAGLGGSAVAKATARATMMRRDRTRRMRDLVSCRLRRNVEASAQGISRLVVLHSKELRTVRKSRPCLYFFSILL